MGHYLHLYHRSVGRENAFSWFLTIWMHPITRCVYHVWNKMSVFNMWSSESTQYPPPAQHLTISPPAQHLTISPPAQPLTTPAPVIASSVKPDDTFGGQVLSSPGTVEMAVQYSTVRYSTVQYSTVQYSIAVVSGNGITAANTLLITRNNEANVRPEYGERESKAHLWDELLIWDVW